MPGQLHFLVDALLKLGRQLPVILYPKGPFFSSRFSAVISAMTFLSLWTLSSHPNLLPHNLQI